MPFFRRLFLLISITASIGSVLLYIVVYGMTRKSVRRARKIQMGSEAADAFERRQRKLTRTMNVSCLITLIFFVTPLCMRFLIGGTINTTVHDILVAYAGISCNFNPLAILAALFIMQEDVKEAVLSSLPHCFHRLIPSNAPNETFGNNLSELAIWLTTQATDLKLCEDILYPHTVLLRLGGEIPCTQS
ncbi:unnamed protein product [Gongylonema pulchrum]|uniref:G_PROTEIN_RECEP_F1_2 domain-containing protein n=1 Tax=Gongylonema pulchrum TaxID=637853 RepID=A0A183E9K8_9BILA|nr:unnamed protein product [Gongylonema pulchrum]